MEKITQDEKRIVADGLEELDIKDRKPLALSLVEAKLGDSVAKNLDKFRDEDRLEVAQAIIEKNYKDIDLVMSMLNQKERDTLSDRLIDSGLSKVKR